ncbi:MAG: chemotaxis-specific protein-glutamate methyltransferase CheB [bacterium]|nr:chemotaxis-specific protein-glutamate methyltransferase CheB [bacterium]MDT8366363.1 chemotaxis-specific protein-glutamate methyltransferase CheB [bacterium]
MTTRGNGKKGHLTVLVVDDSAYNRKMIRGMLTDMDEVDTVEAVSDGEEAIRTVMTNPPDVITLDLNMPRMDGFTFLRWLMRNNPIPVIVVSAEGGEKNVFKALDLGALDFVVKPVRYASERIMGIRGELQEKIRAIAGKDMGFYLNRLKLKKPAAKPVHSKNVKVSNILSPKTGILVIGASTGGPSAVQRVLSELPENYPLPVIVVQHMPPVFTRQFALRLDRNTALRGMEAADGDKLEAGTVLVAPGGHHIVISGNMGRGVEVVERKQADRFVPSVNMTMSSAAGVYGDRTIGVLLTGMGNDGADGLNRIKEAGGYTIAESEESSVVYGMPRAAVLKGAAQEVLHLDKIGSRIVELTRGVTGLKNTGGGGTKKP